MNTLTVTFATYVCLGAVRILGVSVPLASFPDSLKPAMAVAGACRPVYHNEIFDPGRAPAAWARLAELGPNATISRCRPMSCKPIEVDWTHEPAPRKGELP